MHDHQNLPAVQSWGLSAPGRSPTPCDGHAQSYSRIGPPDTQKVRIYDNGTCLSFGPNDIVDEFNPGQHPFLEQVLGIDKAIRDLKANRQRHEGEGRGGTADSAVFDEFRSERIHYYNIHWVDLPSGRYVQVPSRYASLSDLPGVYNIPNKSDLPGLAHPGYTNDTRFGVAGPYDEPEHDREPEYHRRGRRRGPRRGGRSTHTHTEVREIDRGQRPHAPVKPRQFHGPPRAGQLPTAPTLDQPTVFTFPDYYSQVPSPAIQYDGKTYYPVNWERPEMPRVPSAPPIPCVPAAAYGYPPPLTVFSAGPSPTPMLYTPAGYPPAHGMFSAGPSQTSLASAPVGYPPSHGMLSAGPSQTSLASAPVGYTPRVVSFSNGPPRPANPTPARARARGLPYTPVRESSANQAIPAPWATPYSYRRCASLAVPSITPILSRINSVSSGMGSRGMSRVATPELSEDYGPRYPRMIPYGGRHRRRTSSVGDTPRTRAHRLPRFDLSQEL